MSTFFVPVFFLFIDLVPCLPFPLFHAWNISFFYTMDRSVTFFFLVFSRMSSYFMDWYLVYLFHIENFRSVTAYAGFFVSFCLLGPRLSIFSCELIFCLPLSRSEYVVLIHYRLLKSTFDNDRCLIYTIRGENFPLYM